MPTNLFYCELLTHDIFKNVNIASYLKIYTILYLNFKILVGLDNLSLTLLEQWSNAHIMMT